MTESFQQRILVRCELAASSSRDQGSELVIEASQMLCFCVELGVSQVIDCGGESHELVGGREQKGLDCGMWQPHASATFAAFLPLTETLAGFDQVEPSQEITDTLVTLQQKIGALPDPSEQDAAREYLITGQVRLEALGGRLLFGVESMSAVGVDSTSVSCGR